LEAERQRALARAAGLRRDRDAIVEAAALSPPDDEHDPEGSTVGFERALVIDLLTQAEADVAALDLALADLDAGYYGRCEACGQPIAGERLAAHPTTRHCVRCAQARAAATSSRVRATLNSGVPGSKRRPSASEPAS
jgi:RNA polymerase-binding transcription factor DksA